MSKISELLFLGIDFASNGEDGFELLNTDDFLQLVVRFSFNLIMSFVIVRFLYYPSAKRKDYLFTFILLGVIIFLLCYVLKGKNLDTGLALGLFAIFGIIRYRTQQIPIKEMTYLFIVIGLSVVNALFGKKVSLGEILFINVFVIGIVFAIEKVFLLKHETRKTIIYEKIDLIKPERYSELKKDIEDRTGLIINRIEIGNIDFMRDVARIRIYYFESDNRINLVADEQDNIDEEI